jgi:predicted nuclease of restriction endonuclease-like (RecB) superfamily
VDNTKLNETETLLVANFLRDYDAFLRDIKARVQTARVRASLAVNSELVLLYWSIGRDILGRQKNQGWGAKMVDRLSNDLRREFPEMTGLSSRNLKYMRSFAAEWSDQSIVQAPLAQLTWYHNIALLEKLTKPTERLWYAHSAIQYGWSRNVLVHQIETNSKQAPGLQPAITEPSAARQGSSVTQV